MFKKSIFCFIFFTAMFVFSSCGPMETPATEPDKVAKFSSYTKEDKCPIQMPNAGGEVTFQASMKGGFNGMLRLSNLDPGKPYTFTINGFKNKAGNDLLRNSCSNQTNSGEGFCNYGMSADRHGEINELVTIALEPGQYVVKFLIKDDEQNDCVLLYNNDNQVNF